VIKLTVQVLIISLLSLNIAWAVDECALTNPGEVGGLSIQNDTQPSDDPINAGLDCDDWCHAWATPIALPSTIVHDGYTPDTINGNFYTLSYSSLPIPPPFHPPIV
jgi:hypothetical protein